MGKRAQAARAPASELQSLVRSHALRGGPVQALKGQEVFECQAHSGVSLELWNCKETIRWLKGEIDVGLQRLELALKRVENCGLLKAEGL